jgi:hypothetical protein
MTPLYIRIWRAAANMTRGRIVFLCSCLLLSLGGYAYIVNVYDPSQTFEIFRPASNYNFYSGSPSLFYSKIGRALETPPPPARDRAGALAASAHWLDLIAEAAAKWWSGERPVTHRYACGERPKADPSAAGKASSPSPSPWERFKAWRNDDVHIANIYTCGGADNALKVLGDSQGFGIVQEDAFKNDDFLRERINYITPLFMERLHIIYNKDMGACSEKETSEANGEVFLTARPNLRTKCFFRLARIGIGPVGSTTHIISSYIFNEVKDLTGRRRPFSTDSFGDAFRKLREGELDVAFALAGAPLPEIRELLDNKKFGLMSIDPSLISAVNKTNGVNLRFSDFKDKYNGVAGNVTTLGSYAFLISSKHLHEIDAYRLLSVLNEDRTRKSIREQVGLGPAPVAAALSAPKFQLDEIDFYRPFYEKYRGYVMLFVKRLAIFAASVLSLGAASAYIIISAISFFNLYFYSRQATRIYEKISCPEPPDMHKEALLSALRKIIAVNNDLHKKYPAWMKADDHEELLRKVSRIKAELRSALTRCLIRLIDAQKSLPPGAERIDQETILAYYSDACLSLGQYKDMSDLLKDGQASSVIVLAAA